MSPTVPSDLIRPTRNPLNRNQFQSVQRKDRETSSIAKTTRHEELFGTGLRYRSCPALGVGELGRWKQPSWPCGSIEQETDFPLCFPKPQYIIRFISLGLKFGRVHSTVLAVLRCKYVLGSSSSAQCDCSIICESRVWFFKRAVVLASERSFLNRYLVGGDFSFIDGTSSVKRHLLHRFRGQFKWSCAAVFTRSNERPKWSFKHIHISKDSAVSLVPSDYQNPTNFVGK
ncbi:hypothetical protein Tco_1220149 [Tanacetum coccineum]